MANRGSPPAEKPEEKERVLTAAGSFTGLWALTWLGTTALGASAAVQGGFAVGGVMAASGLTVLWWKTQALRMLADDEEAAAELAEEPVESRAG